MVASFEFAPYVHTEPDGRVSGLVVEIARRALTDMGLEAVFQPLPWKRAMANVTSGKSDGVLPIYKTKSRMEKFSFSGSPIYHFRIALFRKAGSPDIFDGTIESLFGKSFARLDGSVTSPEFEKAIENGDIAIEKVSIISSKFKMLDAGRVDFATGIWLSSLRMIDELGLSENIVASNISISSRPAFLAMPKSEENDRFLTRFDAAIEKLNELGITKTIIARYSQ